MTSAALAMVGFQQAMKTMNAVKDAAKNQRDAWVGTVVFYGPYHEFGTQHLRARPHWRPAITQVITEVSGSKPAQHDVLLHMIGTKKIQGHGSAPLAVALRIERAVKVHITKQGVIDTGNYRASVAAGISRGAVERESLSRAVANPERGR